MEHHYADPYGAHKERASRPTRRDALITLLQSKPGWHGSKEMHDVGGSRFQDSLHKLATKDGRLIAWQFVDKSRYSEEERESYGGTEYLYLGHASDAEAVLNASSYTLIGRERRSADNKLKLSVDLDGARMLLAGVNMLEKQYGNRVASLLSREAKVLKDLRMYVEQELTVEGSRP